MKAGFAGAFSSETRVGRSAAAVFGAAGKGGGRGALRTTARMQALAATSCSAVPEMVTSTDVASETSRATAMCAPVFAMILAPRATKPKRKEEPERAN